METVDLFRDWTPGMVTTLVALGSRAGANRKRSESMKRTIGNMTDEEKEDRLERSFHSSEARQKGIENIRKAFSNMSTDEIDRRMRCNVLRPDVIEKRIITQRENFNKMSSEEKFQWYKQSFGSEESLRKASGGFGRWWSSLSKEERQAFLKGSLQSPKAKESVRRYHNGISQGEYNRRMEVARRGLTGEVMERRRSSFRSYLAGLSLEEMEDRMRHSCLTKEGIRKSREANSKRPSEPEIFLGLILERHYPGLVAYNGGGQSTDSLKSLGYLGLKVPDFWIIGKRAVIEVLGGLGYWHFIEEEEEKITYYRRYGFSCLVLFEHECYLEGEVIRRIDNLLMTNWK